MPNHQLLDNLAHKNIKIQTHMHPKFGDIASYAHVFVSEFRELQNEYPLFFRKNSDSGQFECIALLGFDQQENLYLDEDGWHANYIPLTVQRRPFLIGLQKVNSDGVISEQPMVHIDMDNPRVNETEGEAVFLEQGGQSPYLQRMSSVLKTIHEGHQETGEYIQTLLKHELIEAVSIKVTLNNGTRHELGSLYAVHEENLAALQGDALNDLHRVGYLQLLHFMLASTANLSRVIEKKNQRL